MYNRIILMLALSSGLISSVVAAQTSPQTVHLPLQGMQLDLEKIFHTRSPWRLVVTEGVPVKDAGDNDAPGKLTLCLHKRLTGPCIWSSVPPPSWIATSGSLDEWEPHYLLQAKLVYPGKQAAPLLLIVTGSLRSGDGDQFITTQLLSYNLGRDEFRRVFGKNTGHNNNQEVRFITDGPLQGSIISAEPEDHSPFGYWIVVEKLTPSGTYRPVLRYRSATLYNDDNALAVIDSEMQTIERRLGLWKPGDTLPAPNHLRDGKRCLRPTLRHAELWCG